MQLQEPLEASCLKKSQQVSGDGSGGGGGGGRVVGRYMLLLAVVVVVVVVVVVWQTTRCENEPEPISQLAAERIVTLTVARECQTYHTKQGVQRRVVRMVVGRRGEKKITVIRPRSWKLVEE
jgi:predicted metalloprotease